MGATERSSAIESLFIMGVRPGTPTDWDGDTRWSSLVAEASHEFDLATRGRNRFNRPFRDPKEPKPQGDVKPIRPTP